MVKTKTRQAECVEYIRGNLAKPCKRLLGKHVHGWKDM
jgi:hypothetical protein